MILVEAFPTSASRAKSKGESIYSSRLAALNVNQVGSSSLGYKETAHYVTVAVDLKVCAYQVGCLLSDPSWELETSDIAESTDASEGERRSLAVFEVSNSSPKQLFSFLRR